MDQMTLLYVIAGFVLISAIALCAQAASLIGIYRATQAIGQKIHPLLPKVEALLPKVEALLESSKLAVDHGRKQMMDITTKANDILESTRGQLSKVEGVITDATTRAKVQMDRVELVLDDTITRAHETVATVHGGIIRPLREINGISVGIRAALNHIARGARPNVAQVTSDEEMFI